MLHNFALSTNIVT